MIGGDYFEALGIELIRGTVPSQVDLDAEPVVWVNEILVREVLHDVEPLGQQIYIGDAPRRIVGIVEDVPYGPRGELSRKLYMPHAQYADDRNWAMIQTVRAQGDLAALRNAIGTAMEAIDPQLVLYRPQTFSAVLQSVRAQDRFAAVLMMSFAGLALTLSLVGTYGVLAGAVAGRTRELGIRMALGADRRSVRAMVLRHSARVTAPGIVLGLAGAWSGSRFLQSLLFEVDAASPLVYAWVVGVFVTCGLVSAWLPARRATRVDAVQSLAAE
jgi:hypothetical protein